MSDKKISELPFGQLNSSSIIPIVNAGTTSQTTFGNMLSQIPGGGGGAQLISCTKTELDVLVTNNSLSVGATYEISGVHPTLYDDGNSSGTTIFLQALTTNKLSLEGSGLFYNPTYDQSVAGYGIWHNRSTWDSSLTSGIFQANEYITADNGATGYLFTTLDANIFISTGGDWSGATSIMGDSSSATANVNNINVKSYKIGDKVIWGGYVWTNLMGFVGNSVDSLVLDFEWSKNVYDTTEIPVPTPPTTPFTITSFVMIDGQLQMYFNPYDGIVSGLNVQVLINGTWYDTEEINDAYVSNESPVNFNSLIIGGSLHRLQNRDNLSEFSNEFYTNNIGTYNEPIIDNSGYNLGYKSTLDLIHYDYENDLIIHREDTSGNVVSTSKSTNDLFFDDYSFEGNPINIFQWGNIYNYFIDKGIGNNKIENSYCNNINYFGRNFNNNTLTSNSYFYGNTLSSSSNFQNNTLSSSSNFRNNTLSSNSYFYGNTLSSNSYFQNNTLSSNSYFQNNRLSSDSYFEYNTLSSNSGIYINTLSSSFFISNILNSYCTLHLNTLSNYSSISLTIANDSSRAYSNTLTDGSLYSNISNQNSTIANNVLTSGKIQSNTLNKSSISNNSLTVVSFIEFNKIINGTISYNGLIGNGTFGDSTIGYNILNVSNLNMGLTYPLTTKKFNFVTIDKSIINNIDLSGANHIYASYPKTIYSRPDGTSKLRYYDDSDVLVITDITA